MTKKGSELGVVAVAILVAGGLLGEIRFESLREVNARLVRKADEHPQHVGHLIGEVVPLARLKGLVSIASCHNAGQFADLLGQHGHIGQLAKIAHPVGTHPFVHTTLHFAEFHLPNFCSQDTKIRKQCKERTIPASDSDVARIRIIRYLCRAKPNINENRSIPPKGHFVGGGSAVALVLILSVALYERFALENTHPATEVRHPTDERTDTLVVGIVGDSWAAGRKADSMLDSGFVAAGIPCKIISSGHPGATSKQVYRNLFTPIGTSYSSQHLLREQPRYCLVLCGVNDSNGQYGSGFYSHHTRLILHALLDSGIEPILLQLPDFAMKECYEAHPLLRLRCRFFALFTSDDGYLNIPSYRRRLETDLGREGLDRRILYIPFQEVSAGYVREPECYRADGIHLSPKGYRRLSDAVVRRIRQDLDRGAEPQDGQGDRLPEADRGL